MSRPPWITPTVDDTGQMIRFRLEGTAAPKERARHRIVTPKGRKPFISVYTPKETVEYEKRVAAVAGQAWGRPEPSMRPIELQVTVVVAIPDGWPKWKREAATRGEIAPTGVPDLDNIVKAIQDGMNKVVYRDDGQIVSTDAVKMYATDGGAGHVEVAVRENYRAGSWIAKLADLFLLR